MFAATAAISAKLVQPAPVQRSIRNPSSLLESSVQLKFTWVCELGVAVRPLGAAGAGRRQRCRIGDVGIRGMPPALNAATRYR